MTEEPHRILIVEDDYLIATNVEASLLAAGFAVVGVFPEADPAIECARQTRPALAIMDIRLRGQRDGVDAALELFRDLGIRSLMASANQDDELRERAAAARPVGWLTKPYDPSALVRAVRKALSPG